MKVILATCLAALIGITGCSTTSVEVTGRDGNTMKIPAELYAVKMQQEYADKAVSKACDKINEPMPIPDNIQVKDDGAWAIAFMAMAHGQAKEDCADAMAQIAAVNKPDSYLKYKIADKKATWGIITKVAGIGLTAGCMFQVGGMCGGRGGNGGGNEYGDNWTFNQSTGASGSLGGEGGMHGAGGEGTFRPSNNVNFGHGNVMGSDLSSSLAGMNERTTFMNGGGGGIDNSENFDNSFNDTAGDDSLQSDF